MKKGDIAANDSQGGKAAAKRPKPGSDAGLRSAAQSGDLALIASEIAHGADPNAVREGAQPGALMIAVQAGHPQAVKALLALGADPNPPSSWSPAMKASSPLLAACGPAFGSHAMAKTLLDAGAKPNQSFDGERPLLHAAGWSEPITRLLLGRGALVGSGALRLCAMRRAVASGQGKILEMLARAMSPADVAAGVGQGAIRDLFLGELSPSTERGMRALLRSGVSPWAPKPLLTLHCVPSCAVEMASLGHPEWLDVLFDGVEHGPASAKALRGLAAKLSKERPGSALGLPRLLEEIKAAKAHRERAALSKAANASQGGAAASSTASMKARL